MKKTISLILLLAMCLALCACGASASPSEKVSNGSDEEAINDSFEMPSIPQDTPMYTPGMTVKTNFGEITIIDAAFCGKAQLIDALPSPAYNTAKEGCIVFAMRTLISNTSDADLMLMDDLKVTVQYAKEEPFACSKGGNYNSSDPLYKTLPAGASGEYLISSGRIPIELYQKHTQFHVSIQGEEMMFDNKDISIYNAMGYQDGDNAVASIDDLMHSAETKVSEDEPEYTKETEAVEASEEISFIPAVYPENPETNIAEGVGVVIQNVELGFADQLPKDLLKYSPSEAEKMTLNDSMVYAVVQFKIKNLTSEDVDIADLHDDFLVQINYNNGFHYDTNSDAGACYIAQGKHKIVRKNSSSGQAINVAPLTEMDVMLYIPCAREVSTNSSNPLHIIFNSKYGGYESFEFVVR